MAEEIQNQRIKDYMHFFIYYYNAEDILMKWSISVNERILYNGNYRTTQSGSSLASDMMSRKPLHEILPPLLWFRSPPPPWESLRETHRLPFRPWKNVLSDLKVNITFLILSSFHL